MSRHARPSLASPLKLALYTALFFVMPAIALAEDALDTGDTAWILTSTALVLFMTIPGLALFYGGLVRTKNVLSVLMQCLALTALMTILWLAVGYSLAFDTTGMVAGEVGVNSFIGTFGKAFLSGVNADTLKGTIPEVLFFAFQCTFAVITPALMIGAFAERMKFSAVLIFSTLWLLVVYIPICHMTWGGPGGLFADWGVFDFAGGIVVHITAGVAALVACIVIGPRNGYPTKAMPPHNLTKLIPCATTSAPQAESSGPTLVLPTSPSSSLSLGVTSQVQTSPALVAEEGSVAATLLVATLPTSQA